MGGGSRWNRDLAISSSSPHYKAGPHHRERGLVWIVDGDATELAHNLASGHEGRTASRCVGVGGGDLQLDLVRLIPIGQERQEDGAVERIRVGRGVQGDLPLVQRLQREGRKRLIQSTRQQKLHVRTNNKQAVGK